MSLLSSTDMVSGKVVYTYSIDYTDLRATAIEQDGSVIIKVLNGIDHETISCILP